MDECSFYLSEDKDIHPLTLVDSSSASSVDSEASTVPADSDNDLPKVSSRKRRCVLETRRLDLEERRLEESRRYKEALLSKLDKLIDRLPIPK